MIIEEIKKINPDIKIEDSPKGIDYDFSIQIFDIVKKSGKKVEEVTKEIAEKLKEKEFIEKIDIIGPYINIKINWRRVAKEILENILSEKIFEIKTKKEKIIIEHTSANPNKALHIGHIRNSFLGDFLNRFLKFAKKDVEVLYYVNDTGVQIADILLALELGFPENIKDINKIEENLKKSLSKRNFDIEKLKEFLKEVEYRKKLLEEVAGKSEILNKYDIYFGEFVYVLINKLYKLYPELEKEKYRIVKDIESQGEFYKKMVDITLKILKEQVETLKKFDINIDLFVRESDIINFGLFKETFEILKNKGIVKFVEKGEKKGTWCIDLESLGEFEESIDKLKVLIRSDGTTVYIANDISYALWKHGLINKDFLYKKFDNAYITSLDGEKIEKFGKADISINVIGSEQKFEQKIVSKIVNKIDEKKKYIHYAYSLVYLSKDTAKLLGYETEKQTIKMSGRKGLEIPVDILLEKLKEIIKKEFTKRNQKIDETKAFKIARSILKYEFLKYSPEKPIIFDINQAIKFEEKTGTYVLYTLARAKSIIRKGKESLKKIRLKDISIKDLCKTEINLLKEFVRFRLVIEDVLKNLKPNILIKYLDRLCLRFNEFYQTTKVLKEINENPHRIFIVLAFIKIVEKIFQILGIDIIEEF